MRGTFADGQQLVAARQARGLTQEQLATKAGLDVKTVRKAEQGKRLDITTLSRLAVALDVELYRLVQGSQFEADGELARREVVLRWYRAWDTRDADTLGALYHDDAVLYLPGDPTIPFGGTFRGRAAIRQCHETAWATCQTEPTPVGDFSLFVSGDTVVLRGVKGVTLPSGEVVRLWSIQIFTLDGDRIVEQRVEFDTLKFCQLLQLPLDGPPNG